MPYVKHEKRELLDDSIDYLSGSLKNASPNGEGLEGNLNYSVTRLLLALYGDPSYKKINNMVGVLECIKQELYRRYVSDYENLKAKENGDVYK